MWILPRGAALASSKTRAPDLLVLVNGAPVAGVIDAEVSSNAHLAADRYRLNAALTESGYAVWNQATLQIEVRMALDGAWASMILGPADRLEVDAGRGVVSVEGRDMTAAFIAARTQETFENQTSSQIATTLAGRHGLQAAVTPTSGLVGRNFQNDHARTTLDQHAGVTTEWDLLIRLAELESFDVWVSGQTLNFAPPGPVTAPLVLTPADCLEMRLERDLTLSGGVTVSVKSWDCRGQQSVVQTASSVAIGGSPLSYMVLQPNLTGNAASQLAQRMMTQMAQQARTVCIDMPGDLTTFPRGGLTLADTGTDFDGAYFITDVERRISFERGYTQTIQARLPPWTDFSTS